MKAFEYTVVPAPKKGLKAKGVKTTEDRFAHAMAVVMNEYGAEGWEYVRTDILPSEERQGLTGRTTVYQNMMVFKREITQEPPTALLAAPTPEERDAPELVATKDEHMMRLDDTPLEDDPARPEPPLKADS